MNKEEKLLIPRLVCTTDYLNNKFGVNQIIPLQWNETFNDWEYKDCSTEILLKCFLQYKQFELLPWWAERQVEEMPQYVKYEGGSLEFLSHNPLSVGVYKVTDAGLFKYSKEKLAEDASQFFCKLDGYDIERRFNYSHFLPATEQEYKTYIKQKKA